MSDALTELVLLLKSTTETIVGIGGMNGTWFY
jgi:hypothetical protein